MLKVVQRWQQHSLEDRGGKKNHFCLLLFMNFEHLGCYFSHSQLYLENLIDFKEAHGGMQMVPLGICEKPEITSFISRQT